MDNETTIFTAFYLLSTLINQYFASDDLEEKQQLKNAILQSTEQVTNICKPHYLDIFSDN